MEAHRVSPDCPLEDPAHDRLGYKPFAAYLAEALRRMDSTQGFVVALYGAWGSGKSTLLNFVEREISQGQPKEAQPIIVRFNPWWFSGHEDLAARFFDQLLLTLDEKGYGEREIRKQIANLANNVSDTNLPHAWIPKLIGYFIEPKRQSVVELKEDIDGLLQDQHRLLVIIDDIDRLLAEEIRQLFRVIKAVANFSNIIYLLAFDREVVTGALADTQPQALADTRDGAGQSYLEKIVQASFELPLPEETSLQTLFAEQLSAVSEGTPERLFDQGHWQNLFFEGINPFLVTPRDVIRFTNTLYVTYAAVKGEVNLPDFVAVEALRIFCPQIYSVIRDNKDAFTGHSGRSGLLGRTAAELKPFHDTWLETVSEGDRDAVQHLAKALFPKLEAVWGQTHYQSQWESTWHRELRVCSADIFPTYFKLAVPESGITSAEMQYILSLTSDSGAFSKALLELVNQVRVDGTSRLRVVLDRLVDYAAEEIPEDNVASMVHTFFDIGDHLERPQDENLQALEFGNDVRIGRILWQLLPRLSEPERFRILREAIREGRALHTITSEVAVMGQQHGKLGAQARPEAERIVNAKHLAELEELAVNRIREAARRPFNEPDSLLQLPQLEHSLYRWHDWGNESEIRNWFISMENEGLTDADLTKQQREDIQRFSENLRQDRSG